MSSVVPMDGVTSGNANPEVFPLSHESLIMDASTIGNTTNEPFPLSDNSVVVYILANSNLDPQDLVKLEATCSFFKKPSRLAEPFYDLSLTEIAAFDMCQKRSIFKQMAKKQHLCLIQKCGGSWKLGLRYILAGERCSRRRKSLAIAGPTHSVALTSEGDVYSFGSNSSGELGHGNTEKMPPQPCLIRSLQGIRIVNVAAWNGRTMLVTDSGQVYAFGEDSFGLAEHKDGEKKILTTPHLMESLKDIFVVQVSIGHYFTAILSREGLVYTFSWGDQEKLGHKKDPNDLEPRPLLGALENLPVVQISAGYCFLLALVCEAGSMSVYSIGCGLGGKLGHGTEEHEKLPRLIEEFKTLNLEPIAIDAGAWHSAVLCKDGRVCTWGWGNLGTLGHGNTENQFVPKVVEALKDIKAVHVSTGAYGTFVVADNGDVYSFGTRASNIGLNDVAPANDEQGDGLHIFALVPELVTSLTLKNDKVVQMSVTNSTRTYAHTLALTESGKLYAFGVGDQGQLGVELGGNQFRRETPEQVKVDLG